MLAQDTVSQGGCRTKIENRDLILDANWAQKLIPTTPTAIRAIFIEIWHLGVFRSNISDPFFLKFCHMFWSILRLFQKPEPRF